jgi:hypothetical protein
MASNLVEDFMEVVFTVRWLLEEAAVRTNLSALRVIHVTAEIARSYKL